jgi:hypothetical protein
LDKPDSKTFFRLIRKHKASSNETAAYKYSCQHRYNIHPQKSALIKTERNKMKSLTEPVKLGENPLQTVNQTVHLGEIASVPLFEIHLKEVPRAHTEVW